MFCGNILLKHHTNHVFDTVNLTKILNDIAYIFKIFILFRDLILLTSYRQFPVATVKYSCILMNAPSVCKVLANLFAYFSYL